MPPTKLDTFTTAYIVAALWSSIGEDGEPLDGLYTVDDIATDTLADMVADCDDFQAANAADIEGKEERAGHDFWLTRNRHGAGFWDGDWPHDFGQRLTQNAHAYGSSDLYVGDDGLIRGS